VTNNFDNKLLLVDLYLVGDGGISLLNRSARASKKILIGINSVIYNYILRIDSKKNTRLRKLKCGMWVVKIG